MLQTLCLSWMLAVSNPAEGLAQALEPEARGDAGAALEAVDAYLLRWPAEVLPRLEAARLRLKLGRDLERAAFDLDVARTLAPENARAQFLLGKLNEETRKPAAAKEAYETALLWRPEYVEARLRLASLLLAEERWAEAEPHYRKLSSAQTQARLGLVVAVEKQGRLNEAEQELKRWLKEQPHSRVARKAWEDFHARTGRAQASPGRSPTRKMRQLPRSRR